MDNPEKLGIKGTQDEDKQNKTTNTNNVNKTWTLKHFFEKCIYHVLFVNFDLLDQRQYTIDKFYEYLLHTKTRKKTQRVYTFVRQHPMLL